MDITLLAIALFILVAIVFLLIFLFKSVNNKTFKANDGSEFTNQLDLDIYNNLYEKTKPLFLSDNENISNQSLLGFDKTFLNKLTLGGLSDLKTLIQYRKQIKLLSDLINS